MVRTSSSFPKPKGINDVDNILLRLEVGRSRADGSSKSRSGSGQKQMTQELRKGVTYVLGCQRQPLDVTKTLPFILFNMNAVKFVLITYWWYPSKYRGMQCGNKNSPSLLPVHLCGISKSQVPFLRFFRAALNNNNNIYIFHLS